MTSVFQPFTGRHIIRSGILTIATILIGALNSRAEEVGKIEIITNTPGLVAFWDFMKREPDGQRRFIAHVPDRATTAYPLDAANYIKDYWGTGREATYADFPQLGRGRSETPSASSKKPTLTSDLSCSCHGLICMIPRWILRELTSP